MKEVTRLDRFQHVLRYRLTIVWEILNLCVLIFCFEGFVAVLIFFTTLSPSEISDSRRLFPYTTSHERDQKCTIIIELKSTLEKVQ